LKIEIDDLSRDKNKLQDAKYDFEESIDKKK